MSICGRKRTHNSSRTPRSAGYRKHPSRAYHTYHNATVCFLRDASNGCASLEPMPDSERPPLCCTCVRPYGQVPVWETRMLHSPWFGSGIGPNTRAQWAKKLLQTNFVLRPHLTHFKGHRRFNVQGRSTFRRSSNEAIKQRGWPADMPAGWAQHRPVGLSRRRGRAARLGVPRSVGRHSGAPEPFDAQSDSRLGSAIGRRG